MPSAKGRNAIQPIARHSVVAGESLLDQLPFPIMRIGADYEIEWMNANGARVYGTRQGLCHRVSHGYDNPCNFHGEKCPKLQAELSGLPTDVLHVHATANGNERFKVVALPMEDGGVLEWHIPLDEIGAIDAVTGLLTRGETEMAAQRTVALMGRLRQPFAVAMLDIDHFKAVNDGYGHAVGDLVLGRVSQLMAAELRKSDVLGRWGGEEFVVILPAVERATAFQVTSRLLEVVRGERISSKETHIRVTISAGVCWVAGDDADRHELEDLVAAADGCMYQAKKAGRDQLKTCTCM